jgi:hypothetical protein
LGHKTEIYICRVFNHLRGFCPKHPLDNFWDAKNAFAKIPAKKLIAPKIKRRASQRAFKSNSRFLDSIYPE